MVSLFGGGCQPLPQPFAHAEDTLNPVATPSPDLAGVTILPISGLPGPVADSLSTAMAKELLLHEVIADTTYGNRRSKLLEAVVRQASPDPGGPQARMVVTWVLSDRKGKVKGRHRMAGTLAPKDLHDADQTPFREEVRAAAARIAGLVKGDADGLAGQSPVSLHVWPLDGAPDGAMSPLRHAMETALKKRNFRVTDGLEGAGLVIAGVIELGPEEAEPRPMRITWSVLDPAGQELGKLTQQNSVPRLMMEKGWKTLAAVIADNAADGVSNLVVHLPQEVLRSGGNPGK